MASSSAITLSLSSDNGSLPPPHRRSSEIRIEADGSAEFESLLGYDRSDPQRQLRSSFVLDAGQRGRLIDLCARLAVFSTNWQEVERPNVGGPGVALILSNGSHTARIPRQPIEAQRAARDELVAGIHALVPELLRAQHTDWRSRHGDPEQD